MGRGLPPCTQNISPSIVAAARGRNHRKHHPQLPADPPTAATAPAANGSDSNFPSQRVLPHSPPVTRAVDNPQNVKYSEVHCSTLQDIPAAVPEASVKQTRHTSRSTGSQTDTVQYSRTGSPAPALAQERAVRFSTVQSHSIVQPHLLTQLAVRVRYSTVQLHSTVQPHLPPKLAVRLHYSTAAPAPPS